MYFPHYTLGQGQDDSYQFPYNYISLRSFSLITKNIQDQSIAAIFYKPSLVKIEENLEVALDSKEFYKDLPQLTFFNALQQSITPEKYVALQKSNRQKDLQIVTGEYSMQSHQYVKSTFPKVLWSYFYSLSKSTQEEIAKAEAVDYQWDGQSLSIVYGEPGLT